MLNYSLLAIRFIAGCMLFIQPLWLQGQTSPKVCDDYPEIQDNYSTLRPNYHEYKPAPCILCDTRITPQCTLARVFEILVGNRQFIAPIKETGKVTNCTLSFVTLTELTEPSVACKGATASATFNQWITRQDLSHEPIVTTVDSKNFQVVNYTLKDHYLHDGKVVRQLVKDGPYIKIVTWGVGNNESLMKATVNQYQWLANCVWASVDRKLKKEVERQFPQTGLSQKAGYVSIRQFEVPANRSQPLDTHIALKEGDYVFIEASGSVKLGPVAGMATASGKTGRLWKTYNKYPAYNHGSLVYFIGAQEGSCRILFNEEEISPSQDMSYAALAGGKASFGTTSGELCGDYFLCSSAGNLTLDINDKKTSDNQSAYRVRVFVIRKDTYLKEHTSSMAERFTKNEAERQYYRLLMDIIPYDLYNAAYGPLSEQY